MGNLGRPEGVRNLWFGCIVLGNNLFSAKKKNQEKI